MFDLEADRIRDLSFDPAIVESERGVILSERLTGLENSNWNYLEEQVKLAAMQAHPYRWSVIGYESDIKAWSREDLMAYHRTYYAPNNATVVVAGDVSLAEVERLAKQYFEPIPAQEPPKPVRTIEPEQLGERRLEVHKDVTTPDIMVVYHVPATNSPEYYALSLLDGILSGGKTSRLYKTLVDEKRLAVEVTSNMPFAFDPFLFYIYAVSADGVAPADLEREIHAVVEDVRLNGVSERELQKAKNQLKMGFYRAMTTNSGRANTIGTYEMFFGDFRKLFDAAAAYDQVSIDDIKAVAQKYLTARNRTVGILRNLEAKEGNND
jgi:predicted Zn-dependent peptidase